MVAPFLSPFWTVRYPIAVALSCCVVSCLYESKYRGDGIGGEKESQIVEDMGVELD